MKRSLLGLLILVLVSGCGPLHSGVTPTTGQPDGGITGIVVLWPTCPVERVGQPPCQEPVATTIDIDGSDGHRVASTRSNESGHFSIALLAGTYSVTAERSPRGGMFSKPVTAVVAAGRWTDVTVLLDTGIR